MAWVRTWLGSVTMAGLAMAAGAQQLPAVPPVTAPPPAAVTAPPSGAPAIMLPAASLPPIPATAAPAAVPPVDAVPEKASLKEIEGYSFGNAPMSLLFTPVQIDMMRSVLAHAEANRKAKPTDIEVTPEMAFPGLLELTGPKIAEEPAIYPSFYLASIFYRSAKDWTVWLNGLRITPQTNSGEVEVVAIAPDRARFRWKPVYFEAISRRIDESRLSLIDKVKHKLTARDTVVIDRSQGAVLFELRPNQSFSAAHMNTFEGKRAAEAPPVLDAAPRSLTDRLDDAASAVLNDMGGTPVEEAPPPAATPPPAASPASQPTP